MTKDARAVPPGGSTATDLAGQFTVVTGASLGIGLGIATAFVDAGAHVMLVARRAEALAQAQASLLERATAGQRVETFQADTSDASSIEALFANVDEQFERLDTFVANAGSGELTPFLEVTPRQWQKIVDLNLTGTFLCVQGAARRMITSPAPNQSILVISSIRALGARPGVLPYAVTKAGLNQLVRVAAYELADHGIRVNALSPGITVTPLVLENNPQMIELRTKDVPLNRPGTPEDMGGAARYLCGPGARFVTGINLVVDGGESLW